jgi:hypothetical protein
VTVKVNVECSNNITLIANQVVICPAVLVLLNFAISQYLQKRETNAAVMQQTTQTSAGTNKTSSNGEGKRGV